MIRHTMKMLVLALLASFALSSFAEAAPKKAVRHRPKHSSRVTSGSTTATTAKKSSSKKKRTAAPARKSTAKTHAKRKPTTKPH